MSKITPLLVYWVLPRLPQLAWPLPLFACLIFVTGFAGLGARSWAGAQEAMRVIAGESAVILERDKSVTLTLDEPNLVRRITESDGRTFILFTAKADQVGSKTKIKFKENGSPNEIDVQVIRGAGLDDPAAMTQATSALTKLLVLAILLEQAFAALFNWRVFLEFFDSRGVKTPLMVLGAWSLVNAFHLDIFGQLVEAYSTLPVIEPPNSWTPLFTAMILAGGSKAVNTVMSNLGLRDNRTLDAAQPKPPKTKAWFSVTLDPSSQGHLTGVFVRPSTSPRLPVDSNMIAGGAHFSVADRLRKYFVRRANRFPMSGGYEVDCNVGYFIEIRGRDATGAAVALDQDGHDIAVPGSAQTAIAFGPGAIIDFKVAI